jgi:WD40 repeat protein/serine/threonine protein kinase
MKTEIRRVCPSCGHEISGAMEFCPVCIFRGALAGGIESSEPSVEGAGDSASEQLTQRYEHYELMFGKDGKPVELGHGAMGVTYKALDVHLRCPVTLKVISEKYIADEAARLRFLREARAAASVRHPNVASVFHLGRTGGNYFYAMEFVEGETLENLIRSSGRLEAKVALEIATQVASGLAAVHKKGLVHRDIKPSNIMVSSDDAGAVTAKIIDLGLAKAVEESGSQTTISMPGGFAGTPEFASPEQFAGFVVDIRSDLYSLGVTLWKMLVGQAPFRRSSAEVMHEHQQSPLPLEQLREVPQPLIALLQVLLEKEPARRFQSPAELLKAMPMIRNAIEAGSLLRRTIRVFLSSTGDVQKERILAERVIRSVAAELNIPVGAAVSTCQRLAEESGEPKTDPKSHTGLVLCPYFLDYQRFQSNIAWQTQIPSAADFDLLVSILWSRLGTLLAPALAMPDGSTPGSGTEYEIAWALDQAKRNRGAPLLHVYRNCATPTPPLEPKEERDAFIRQWDAVQEFFARWEKNSDGNFAQTCSNYRDLQEFEELLRENFRSFLATQVERESGEKVSGRKVPRWKSSPFRGLNFFDFEHAPIFHGRTKAIGEMLEALEAQVRVQRPFVLAVGASGSGKSSLVRAGVLPLLTQPETIEGVGLWRWSVTRPGAGGSGGDCFDAMAAALLEASALPALQDLESISAIRDLATELRGHPDSVALRVRDALDHAAREWKMQQSHSLKERERQLRESGRLDEADLAREHREELELPKARLALVIDQLEELFTAGFSLEVRQKYISALAGLVRSGRVFILATLRSDFYPRYQEFPDLIELAKPSGKFDLRPPTAYELGNMIRLPAEAAGLRFEQKRETGQRLDQALRDAASVTPESLPLLEHVLSLLYEQQGIRGDNLLRWSDYEEVGELKGALAKHAEAVFSMLGPREQSAFPLVMRYLVTLSQGEEEVPNGRTVPYRDFVCSESDNDQKAGAQEFVDLFIEKRLLVADTDPQGEVTVRVAHEALLREWQRIKDWLTENREFLRMRDRLDSSLKLWLSRGKQKDDLLGPGLPLAEGEKLLKDFGSSLSRDQTDYIHGSVAERNRRKHAQERIRYAVTAAITLLAIIAGFQWFRAERQRQSAAQAFKSEAEVAAKLQEQLRQASWTSFSQAERQFQLGEWREGIALLARAIKFDPENQVASQRFFQELIVHRGKALPPLIASFAHRDAVAHVNFSPDGARILTASWDETAKLWDAASGKLIASFAHQGIVYRAAFSPDGARILTASADKTAKLWDAASGKLIVSFSHQDEVNDAKFSPDGTRILTASRDKTAKLWDAASGKLIASFPHQGEVNDAEFSSDGARILTASWDKTAKLWDAASGKLIASLEHQGIVNRAEFSRDGTRILTASRDSTVKLWDAAFGKLIASFEHQDGLLRGGSLISSNLDYCGAEFSPDGARILTASADKTAKLWDAASGKLIASFDHQDAISAAKFSPDGARILTTSADKTAKLWDAASGKLIASFAHQDTIRWAVFSPEGARILTASWDKTAKLWGVAPGELITSFAHQDGVRRAAFSPDGARILTASRDKTAKLWDVALGKLIASFAHQDGVSAAAFSPDGARILTGSADNTAKLWDVTSVNLIASFAHQGEVNSVAFSPDGARILTGSADKTAKLWDAGSGKLIASCAHLDEVNAAAFSPDGARILTGSADKTAKLWDAASGKLIASFGHEDGVIHVAFSSDGARILTGSADNTAKLWSAASGKLLASFDHQDAVSEAAFSPDGARILTASVDKTAKLWDAASGELIASFAHQAGVYCVAFSPDAARILTASADNTAKLWDAASGKLIASFDHQGTVWWAAFSPDGARILTASWDKTAKLWDTATPAELARQVKESALNTTRTGSSVSMASSPAQQVQLLSDIASGLHFSNDGSLVAVNEESRSKLTKGLKDLAQGFGSGPRFIRWFFSTGGDRTVSPASDIKVAEWVENTLLTNPSVTEEWLRNALVFLPDNPLLHIALAAIETESKRADFLRSFGLARLPKNSVVCMRAGEMLLRQDLPELALIAVDKALLADPANLSAQRLRLKVLDAIPR